MDALGPVHRVLVVEDDEAVGRALARALRRAGVEVEVMPDAEAALVALERGAPALVLTDFELPGLDGVGLLLEAKARAPGAARALMSGNLAGVSAAQRRALAPCALLEKPLGDVGAVLALLPPSPAGRAP